MMEVREEVDWVNLCMTEGTWIHKRNKERGAITCLAKIMSSKRGLSTQWDHQADDREH